MTLCLRDLSKCAIFLFLYLAQIEKTLLQPDKGFEFLINNWNGQ